MSGLESLEKAVQLCWFLAKHTMLGVFHHCISLENFLQIFLFIVKDAESHSFVKIKKSGAVLESADISELNTASLWGEQRRTSDSPPLRIQFAMFFTASLFVCSWSTGDGADLTGPDTNPLGFSMSTQRPSNLLYLLLLLHTWFLSAALSAAF